jgi:hypothetical protein
MSDHIRKTIEDALEELRKRENLVIESKRFINQLCAFGKLQPMYPEAEGDNVLGGGSSVIVRRNAFYGKPLATCVREILEMRKRAGHGEATLDEIMAALREGSYDLDGITKDEDGQKRGVAISLAKNAVVFHKLPNGDWGLTEWYPNVKKSRTEKPQTGNGGSKEAVEQTPVPQPEAVQ